MEYAITISDLVKFAMIIMGCWGFYKIITEIIRAITTRHDKEQKWDESAEVIKQEHDKITEKYDAEIEDIRELIDTTHCDTEAKLQEVRAELFILTECMQGVLDGLHQLNCNGKVTEASEKLDSYLNKRAHE